MEQLAGRYKRLFVLPSYRRLAAYLAASSALLGVVAEKLQVNPPMIASGLTLTFASTVILSFLIKKASPESIVTLRRATAMVFVSTALWLFVATIGFAGASLSKSVLSEEPFAFGAFLSFAFELVIINGAFLERMILAAPLSAIHPLFTFAWSGSIKGISFIPIGAGITVILVTVAFLLRLKTMGPDKERSAIHAFQAFLRTWVTQSPAALERILSIYSVEREIKTGAVKFDTPGRQTVLILPGVHPGPFYPVGSYNLPELLFQKLGAKGMMGMTMHRPGSHERNIPNTEESDRYTSETSDFAQKLQTKEFSTNMRGPLFSNIGKFDVTTFALGTQAFAFVSSSPLGSEDIGESAEAKLLPIAQQHGFQLSFIDAHNSIQKERISFEIEDNRLWHGLFEKLRLEPEHNFRVAFAHSSEAEFSHGTDISDAGMGLLLLEAQNTKWALVIVDSNNALPGSKEELASRLGSEGFTLIELCTSDSHNLAARGRTINRGYFALGEATPIPEVATAVVRLARLAETRLAPCLYGTGEFDRSISVLGTATIDDFASLLQRSSTFARRYLELMAALTFALLALVMIT